MDLLKFEMEIHRCNHATNQSSPPNSSIGSSPEEGQFSFSEQDELHLTSSCRCDKISSIFASFGQEKCSVLKSIGFEGLLTIPFLKSPSNDLSLVSKNDDLSLWLYKRFDFEQMCLHLDGGVDLVLTEADVYLIFGIPFEGRRVNFSLNQSQETLTVIRAKLFGQTSESSLSLSSLEDIMTKDYGLIMTESEIDAFKIASVLISMCYLFAPHPQHEFPTHLVKNFVPDVNPTDLNWAQFVLWTLGRAAQDVRLQLSSSSRNISMFGCTHLLQIFYLDNLNFGPLTPYHIVLPRASAYSCNFTTELLVSDSNGLSTDKLMLYGRNQVRPASDVCYTRGWQQFLYMQTHQEETMEDDYLTSIEMLSEGMKFHDKFASDLSRLNASTHNIVTDSWQFTVSSYLKARSKIDETSHNLFSRAASLVKKRIISLYPHHIPQDVTSGTHKRLCLGVVSHQGSSSKCKLPYSLKKAVTTHSNFSMTFIDQMFAHPDVSPENKYRCYIWMTDRSSPFEELNRYWVAFNIQTPLLISGHEVCHCFRLNRAFTVKIVDAIMLLWTFLDERMLKYFLQHEQPHKIWRHFLPASFAEVVKRNGDYLNSDRIRESFTGNHIRYSIEDCQQFIIPVFDCEETWCCYIWDFKFKTITVLDPILMGSSSTQSKEKHQHLVFKLHLALFACKDHFFSGWDVKNEFWHDIYVTDIGHKCTPENSGLYTVHYARSFCGQNKLAFNLKESHEATLCMARGEILYHLLTCAQNKGYKIEHLMDKISYIEI